MKRSAVLTYEPLDSSCNKEGDTIELEGMVKREHVIEDNQGQHWIKISN